VNFTTSAIKSNQIKSITMALRQVLSIIIFIAVLFSAEAMTDERVGQLKQQIQELENRVNAHNYGQIDIGEDRLQAMAKNIESSKEELEEAFFTPFRLLS
jgi:septal ring factor EnvC (AmiA/AmiB activator)